MLNIYSPVHQIESKKNWYQLLSLEKWAYSLASRPAISLSRVLSISGTFLLKNLLKVLFFFLYSINIFYISKFLFFYC